MRQNSIDYPGERPARRAEIVEQPGYTGKHYFVVNYAGRQLTVHAADETAALFCYPFVKCGTKRCGE